MYQRKDHGRDQGVYQAMQIARNGFKGYKYLKIWIKIALILCIVLFMSHAFYINLTKYISGPRTFYDFFPCSFSCCLPEACALQY